MVGTKIDDADDDDVDIDNDDCSPNFACEWGFLLTLYRIGFASQDFFPSPPTCLDLLGLA